MPDYTFAITGQDLSGPAWKTFVDNVKKANEQVAGLGKTPEMDKFSSSVTNARSRIEGLIGTVKGFAVASGAVWAAGQVIDYVKSVEAAALTIADLANKTGLTANQVQALQDLARRSGKTFEEVAASVGKNKLALDTLTQTYVATGQAMDANVIAKVVEMERRSKEASDRIEAHFDKIRAAVASLYVPARASVLESAASAVDGLSRAVNVLDLGKLQNIMATLLNPGRAIATVAQGVIAGSPVDQAKAKVDALQTEDDALIAAGAKMMAGPRPGSVMPHVEDPGPTVDRAAQVAIRLRQARRELDAATRATWGGQGFGGPDPMGMVDPVFPSGTGGSTGGGGGGGEGRDRLSENLKLYQQQAKASKDALADLRAVALMPMPLDDLEREIKLRKEIADAVATATKTAKDPNDPRIAQLKAEITAREAADSAYKKFIDSLKLADTAERTYGDGKREFLLTQNQLNDALDTGRLTAGAYDNAIKVLAMSTEDLRLKNLGLQGGFGGFVAGWQNAQNQFERANNAFAMGGRTFDLVMNGMDQGLAQFVKNGKVELADFLGNFFLTIAQMEVRLAASSLWNAAGGASGIFSGIGNLLGGSSWDGMARGSGLESLVSEAASNILSGLPGRAGGGPLGAGQMAIVGENGPELFMSQSGGTVLNRSQLEALGVSGGGRGDVHVHMGGITVGDLVTPAQLDRAMRITHDAAMNGAIAGIMKLQNSGDVRMRQAGF